MPEIIFNGPEGRLEGRYHHGKGPNSPVALLLHPHPSFGGTLNNRVIYHMFQAFIRRGFSVLRFNFRGVGRSQGTYDDGLGELSDAASALDWMQSTNPDAPQCWIAGFSFGAWIGMQLLMRRPELSGFISVAPPANHYDFSFLAPCPVSGLFVHGQADEVVPEETAAALAERLSAQHSITIDYRTVPGASHFFNHHIEDLMVHVEDCLDTHLTLESAEPG